MDKIYFTITGTSYRYGTELFEKGDRVVLKKELGNKYDHEAIQVKVPGLGVIGYVAKQRSHRSGGIVQCRTPVR